MPRSDVPALLDDWRAALRAVDETPEGSPAREIAAGIAEQRGQEYQAAILRLTGRKDQLEGAVESSWDRLAAARQTRDSARELLGKDDG